MTARNALLTLVCVAAGLVAGGTQLGGQSHALQQHEHDSRPAPGANDESATHPDSGMGMGMMMEHMRSSNRKLDELTKAMNDARGENKVEAIAALLTALVEDRRAMHESMMSGMPGMQERHDGMSPQGAQAPRQ